MWSWLKKLLDVFGEPERDEAGQTPAAPTTRHIQVRTKNIYPRERVNDRQPVQRYQQKERKFRFPVIPDNEPQKRPERDDSPISIHMAKQEARAREASKPYRSQAQAETSREEKTSYRPSELISPIHGRLKAEQPKTNRELSADRTDADSQPDSPAQFAQREPALAVRFVQTTRQSETELPFEALRPKADEGERALPPAIKPLRNVEHGGSEQVYSSQSQQQENREEKEESVHAALELRRAEKEWAAVATEESKAVEAAPQQTEGESAENSRFSPSAPSIDSAAFMTSVTTEAAAALEEPVAEPEATPVLQESVVEPEATPVLEEPVAEPEATPVLEEPVAEPEAEPLQQKSKLEQPVEQPAYRLPGLHLLNPSPPVTQDFYEYTLEQRQLLEETLTNFNVSAQVVGIVKGPSVTRFEVQPAPGVKVNKITTLIDDIKLNMAAKDIRIEAPIPGRNAVGIEVPNIKSEPVFIRRILESDKFLQHPSPLAIALGMDIGGEPIVADIKKMPHGLIAGATGSGKSVCINSIIVSLLFKATPEQVRLLLIDPKMVELAPYNHLPHLVTPVVTDAKQATAALKWAVEEMEKRYALFVEAGVRDIDRYNLTTDEPLPFVVIVIDELADLMMVSPQEVEDCIIRIAQKARACGIHLLLATQRPSVDVITGNIKANVPSRLAFAVFSQVDSRTILDQSGAERLLGRGDMLFLESGAAPIRLQGNYVSDDEIERVVQTIKKQRKPEYLFSKEELEQSVHSYDLGEDPLFFEALLFVTEQGQASASALQRRFRIGYNRAARLIEMMETEGYVAGHSGGKPRAVLITREDAQALSDGTSLL
ncbi:DNA translocase FtsK [Brevibacillus fulvus]|uniref:DNA segregation ATPase FtsK/SpoIIIE-like protein n=1 Tax=Brevibacillus fulvus TaxID=1125967 RepID=A0A938XUL5_9BACL|nr:DNA translocase FtsK [Brevibacillus fulvus]MBM7590768.1 DNA segregation ATPase FtsK/SpoIIIE-like protein [Brevibacillus fulvus]